MMSNQLQTRSLFALIIGTILLSGIARPVCAELIGGIEIGGSGAKAFLFTLENKRLSPTKDGRISASITARPSTREPAIYGGSGVVSALSENSLPTETINTIVAQVKSLVEILKKKGVSEQDIFIAGSSSVEKMRNTDELRDAIAATTSLPLFFISPEQEGIFGLLDALSEETNAETLREKSIFIDVGAGNVKFAYIEHEQPYAFEIPFGTDNLTDSDIGETSTCAGWKAQSCFLQPYFSTEAEGIVRAFPRLRDTQAYPNVYFSGGTAWAVSRITQLEDSAGRYSTLNFTNILNALSHVDTLERVLENHFNSLRAVGLRNGLIEADFVDIRKQVNDVVAYYGKRKASLKNGIALYLWSLELVQRNHSSNTYKELNRSGNWLQYFVAYRKGLITDINIPEYRPTVSRRSRDIER